MRAPILVACLLAACTSMPDRKVEHVNDLIVTEYKLPLSRVMQICGARLGIPTAFQRLIVPVACATLDLENWTCDIFYAYPGRSLEHERLHCKGYWHNDQLQKEYIKWTQKK